MDYRALAMVEPALIPVMQAQKVAAFGIGTSK
jgi:hypothetical protein